MTMRPNRALAQAMRQTGAAASRQSNDELIVRVTAGDPDAIRRMIESNMPLVVKKVRAYLRSRPRLAHLADDMTAAGFVALTEAVQRLAKTGKAGSNPTGYLSIAINGAIKGVGSESYFSGSKSQRYARLARGERSPAVVANTPTDDDAPPEYEMAYDPSGLRELKEELLACARTDDDRAILLLREQGHGDPEIAEAIGRPPSSVYAARKAIEARFLERQSIV